MTDPDNFVPAYMPPPRREPKELQRKWALALSIVSTVPLGLTLWGQIDSLVYLKVGYSALGLLLYPIFFGVVYWPSTIVAICLYRRWWSITTLSLSGVTVLLTLWGMVQPDY